MWRLETGFLEMFLSYFWQHEQKATSVRGYRDFLFDVLVLHERVETIRKAPGVAALEKAFELIRSVNNDVPPVFDKDFSTRAESSSEATRTIVSPPKKRRNTEDYYYSPAEDYSIIQVQDFPSESVAQETLSPKKELLSTEELMKLISNTIPLVDSNDKSKKRVFFPQQPIDDGNCSPDAADGPFENCTTNSPSFAQMQDRANNSVTVAKMESCHFYCTRCHCVFETGDELKQHSLTHHDDDPYCCHLCPRTFTHLFSLKAHQRVHSVERPLACSSCEEIFGTKSALKRHEKIAHGPSTPYNCSYCFKGFKTKASMAKHEALHRGDRAFQCTFCGQSFADRSSLKAHQETHESGDKPYKCDQCTKSFDSRPLFIAHMRMHANERPFICEECGKGFRTQWILKKHACAAADASTKASSFTATKAVSLTSKNLRLVPVNRELPSQSSSGIVGQVPAVAVKFNPVTEESVSESVSITDVQSGEKTLDKESKGTKFNLRPQTRRKSTRKLPSSRTETEEDISSVTLGDVSSAGLVPSSSTDVDMSGSKPSSAELLPRLKNLSAVLKKLPPAK